MEDNVVMHVDWDSIALGSGDMMRCSEANEIIEEIMTVLISRKLTIEAAKRLLSETISSIDKEFILEKRKIGGKII